MDEQHLRPAAAATEPLLPRSDGAGAAAAGGREATGARIRRDSAGTGPNGSQQHQYDDRLIDNYPDAAGAWSSRLRRSCARALSSRRKHFLVMSVVALDVVTLLANIFLQLIACETQQADEPWVKTATRLLDVVGLAFSIVFVLELVACLFAFGWRYFSSKFHLFDAGVIILSFLIEVFLQGPAESIGSLLVVLRMWRLAKISEEVVLGAAERMEMLEHHIDELEAENKHLRAYISSHQDQNHHHRERQSSWA